MLSLMAGVELGEVTMSDGVTAYQQLPQSEWGIELQSMRGLAWPACERESHVRRALVGVMAHLMQFPSQLGGRGMYETFMSQVS